MLATQTMYKDVCVATRFLFLEYGLYMLCVECMICAVDVAAKLPRALPFISTNKTKQTCKRTGVF